jgi:hypothetical protein
MSYTPEQLTGMHRAAQLLQAMRIDDETTVQKILDDAFTEERGAERLIRCLAFYSVSVLTAVAAVAGDECVALVLDRVEHGEYGAPTALPCR